MMNFSGFSATTSSEDLRKWCCSWNLLIQQHHHFLSKSVVNETHTWFIAKRNTLVAKKMSSWKLQWLQISFATWYRHQYIFASRSLLLEKIRRQLQPAKSFCFDLRHAKFFLPSAASRENMLRWDASSNFFRIELRAANFFRIGLHSAKKLLLVSAMRENSCLRLLPAEIFSLSASPLAQDDADSEKFSRTASTGELNFTVVKSSKSLVIFFSFLRETILLILSLVPFSRQ